ncbi:MAG TPA: hypothetical protein P5186_24725 [Candidatus Paceibacterota bacterium]|nr:hypothetical protein [Verrucomicrobiota bacterium]HRY51267.1 hypothetical protein [Candidatus Paceibacterota bacterium]
MSHEDLTPNRSGKNSRPCPATQGLITPADCGARRGSQLNCPADCSYYPFGPKGYDLWLKMDENWGSVAFDYAIRHLGADRFRNPKSPHCYPADNTATNVVLAQSHALYTAFFVERDAAGRTLADRWEAEGWKGLNNDQRVMMGYRRQSYVTVVEIQKVLDHQSALCADLLFPETPPFILMDRTSTPKMARFTRLLAWITHYPHFSRLGGVGIFVEYSIWGFWKELLKTRLAREQAQQPALTLREFLMRDYVWAVDVLNELGIEYHRRVFENIDFYHCVAIYRLVGTVQEVASAIQSKPDFEPEPPRKEAGFAKPLAQFSWLRRGDSAQLDKSMAGAFKHSDPSVSVGTVGNVRLYPNELILETMSKKKFNFARQMVDQYFGNLVRFEKECITDVAHLEMRKHPRIAVSPEVTEALDREFARDASHGIQMDVSRERVPETGIPGLPEDPEARMIQRQLRTLLDDRIPMLEHHTPRECARDASLRPLLIEWMKGQIHHLDTKRLKDGLCVNIDGYLDELELAELK